MDRRHPGSQDASGDIHVGLDSSTPCWNDAIRGVVLKMTEAFSTLRVFKGALECEGMRKAGRKDNMFRPEQLHNPR